MAGWKGRTRGGILGYLIFIYVLRFFGRKPAYILLRFVAFYFMFFSYKAFKSLLILYSDRLGFSFLKSVWMIYRNYNALGEILIDKIVILSGSNSGFIWEKEDDKYIRQMISQGNGGILISAHLGNWEMASQLLGEYDGKFNIVMSDIEHKNIKKLLEQSLKEKKYNVILIREDMSHIYEINKALLNKEFICIHGDRYTDKAKTLSCRFLGETAKFPMGVFSLPVIYGVPISFVYAVKEDISKYRFFASPPKIYQSHSSEGRRQLTEGILQDYINWFEPLVKTYPAQWFNYFDFWEKD